MLESHTVKSIQAIGTSQPKKAIRGLCQCCSLHLAAPSFGPQDVCANWAIVRLLFQERPEHEHPNARNKQTFSVRHYVSKTGDRSPASSGITEICQPSAREHTRPLLASRNYTKVRSFPPRGSGARASAISYLFSKAQLKHFQLEQPWDGGISGSFIPPPPSLDGK